MGTDTRNAVNTFLKWILMIVKVMRLNNIDHHVFCKKKVQKNAKRNAELCQPNKLPSF